MSETNWSPLTMTGFEAVNLDPVEFRILWEGGSDSTELPTWSQQSYTVDNHLPGSDITETDSLGMGPYQRSFRVMCADKYEFYKLRLAQQATGQLRVPAAMNDLVDLDVVEEMFDDDLYATIQNVYFESLTDTRIAVDGPCYGTATFKKDPNDG